MRVAYEVSIASSGAIKLHRIVAPGRIRSTPAVALRSLDLAYLVLGIVVQRIILQIDYSRDYMHYSKVLVLAQIEGLIVELELETLSAVELLPLL